MRRAGRTGAQALTEAIAAARGERRPALIPFVTAGYPDPDRLGELVRAVAEEGDVVEVGVPFSDPMADGVTIQRASWAALASGITLARILDALAALDPPPAAPVVLMSYLNPLLSYGWRSAPPAAGTLHVGYERLARDAARAGVAGFIVPDLPYEEGEPLRAALGAHGLASIQLVTPVTPDERLVELGRASEGFVYAVTITGITGTDAGADDGMIAYLDRVRRAADVPVCAGFGIREPEQVARLEGHADGVIVGSALIERIERGEDPRAFLRRLKGKRS